MLKIKSNKGGKNVSTHHFRRPAKCDIAKKYMFSSLNDITEINKYTARSKQIAKNPPGNYYATSSFAGMEFNTAPDTLSALHRSSHS